MDPYPENHIANVESHQSGQSIMTRVFLAFLDYFLDDEELTPETAAPTPFLKQTRTSNSVPDFVDGKENFRTSETLANKVARERSFSKNAHKCLCKICNKSFDDAFFLRVHEYEHKNAPGSATFSIPRLKKTPISCVCGVCNETFDDEFLLRVHSFEHVDLSAALPAAAPALRRRRKRAPDLECGVCLETFDDAFFLRVHSYEHVDLHTLIETPKPLPARSAVNNICDVCGAKFEDALSLRVHAFDHKDKYFCAICGAGFTSNSDLDAHYRDHSKMELWKKRKKLPKKIAAPIKEHYYYKACSEKFITDPPEPKKRIAKRKRRKGKCEICGALLNKSSLKVHRMLHEGVKRHSCQVCGKKFLRIADAKKHFYVMHSERTRPSCEICGKTVSNATSLRRHILCHSNDRKFPCELCGRRFLAKAELRGHYIVHTGEKPYVCDVCGVALKRGYRRHMETHGVFVESRRSLPTNNPPK